MRETRICCYRKDERSSRCSLLVQQGYYAVPLIRTANSENWGAESSVLKKEVESIWKQRGIYKKCLQFVQQRAFANCLVRFRSEVEQTPKWAHLWNTWHGRLLDLDSLRLSYYFTCYARGLHTLSSFWRLVNTLRRIAWTLSLCMDSSYLPGMPKSSVFLPAGTQILLFFVFFSLSQVLLLSVYLF